MILNVAAYHFVHVVDPDALVRRLRSVAASGALRGTILVAGEGINLFLAGGGAAVHELLDVLTGDARFAQIRLKFSHSATQPFARLKVKRKSEIISFRRENASPLVQRAPAVTPEVLARWIAQGHDDAGRRLVLLDTRNRVEVAHGSFAGAMTLPIDRFTEFPEAVAAQRDTLADATVVSFCTGGIRCEKAALWMRHAGMSNVAQLEGGILGYFERVGGFGYDGACFVFDERVALDPHLQPAGSAEAEAGRR